jgi:hypothetical protein
MKAIETICFDYKVPDPMDRVYCDNLYVIEELERSLPRAEWITDGPSVKCLTFHRRSVTERFKLVNAALEVDSDCQPART